MNFPNLYHSLILWIGDGTGLPDAILHIHAGLAILLATRLVSGRSLATFIPFAVVVFAELGNEVMDYLAYGARWIMQIFRQRRTALERSPPPLEPGWIK